MDKRNSNKTGLSSKERRRHARYALGCPVGLFLPTTGYWRNPIARSRTDNISNGGCYLTLEKNPDLPADQVLRLTLNVPRQTPNTYMLEPVRTAARIVRIETSHPSEIGLALQFEESVELQLDE